MIPVAIHNDCLVLVVFLHLQTQIVVETTIPFVALLVTQLDRQHSEPLTSPLFFNQKGQALSRYGITYILKKYVSQAELDSDTRKISPHVLRHTKAMHLLRAGVNMIYIRDFLGHVDISTTEVYARIDAEMKRKVFEEKVPNFTPNTTMPWEEDKDLLQWLTQFGKKSF